MSAEQHRESEITRENVSSLISLFTQRLDAAINDEEIDPINYNNISAYTLHEQESVQFLTRMTAYGAGYANPNTEYQCRELEYKLAQLIGTRKDPFLPLEGNHESTLYVLAQIIESHLRHGGTLEPLSIAIGKKIARIRPSYFQDETYRLLEPTQPTLNELQLALSHMQKSHIQPTKQSLGKWFNRNMAIRNINIDKILELKLAELDLSIKEGAIFTGGFALFSFIMSLLLYKDVRNDLGDGKLDGLVTETVTLAAILAAAYRSGKGVQYIRDLMTIKRSIEYEER